MSGQLHSHSKDPGIGEIVGPYSWGIIHYVAESFPCEPCAQEAKALMRFAHDLVNFRLGKSIQYRANFQAHIQEIQLLTQGMEMGACEYVNGGDTCQMTSAPRSGGGSPVCEISPDVPRVLCVEKSGRE